MQTVDILMSQVYLKKVIAPSCIAGFYTDGTKSFALYDPTKNSIKITGKNLLYPALSIISLSSPALIHGYQP